MRVGAGECVWVSNECVSVTAYVSGGVAESEYERV